MKKTFLDFLKLLLIVSAFFVVTSHSAHAATFTIPTSTATVDGTTFCGGKACTSLDTIIIAAGARGSLLLQNFNGNGSYITIKNELKIPSTPVTITNNNAAGYGVLSIRNCQYIDLRGDNDPALITTSKSKGIIVNNRGGWSGTPTAKAGALWIYGSAANHIKVSYIEANGKNGTGDPAVYNITNQGVGFQIQDYTLAVDTNYTDIEVSHLWLHHHPAQGAYFGPNDPYHQQEGEFGVGVKTHLRRISVHDCIVEDVGAEGWDLKGLDQGPNEFYNNRILRTGVETYAETLGAEQSTGTLTARKVYKITATQTNHFGTGYIVGREFVARGTEICDANNKVRNVYGGKWPEYKNYGDMQVGMKVTFATHGAVVNIHDNYFEATGGPSILASGAYTHEQLNAIDGGIGGRIYVYDNIIVNAGVHGGTVPWMAWLNGAPFPQFQSAIDSEYNNYHMDVHDNIIVKPNKYGLVVTWSGDVMTANRNIISETGTAENYVRSGGIYTEGTGSNANSYYADTDAVGFTAWSDDGNYANDNFTILNNDTTAPAVPTGLVVR